MDDLYSQTCFRAAQRWSIRCDIPGVDPWLIIQSVENHPNQGIVCFVHLQAEVPDYQRSDPQTGHLFTDQSRMCVELSLTADALEKSVRELIEAKSSISTHRAFSEFRMRREDWGEPPSQVSKEEINELLKAHFVRSKALYSQVTENRDISQDEYEDSLVGLLESGEFDRAVAIMEKDPNRINAPVESWTQSCPIHIASSLDLARWLIAHGADVNARGEGGERPLHHAARYGHVEMARLLLDSGADVNATDDAGFTPIFTATRGREPECTMVVASLEQHGARIDFNTAICLQRPELIREFMKDPDAVKKARFPGFLVEDMVILVQCRIWKEATNPLNLQKARTIVREHLGDIKQLLDMGGDVSSRTALFYAVQLPDTSVAELLLQRGADPNRDVGQGTYMTEVAQVEEMRALLRKYGAQDNPYKP